MKLIKTTPADQLPVGSAAICTMQFTTLEIEAMLTSLNFALSAAILVLDQENAKGSTKGIQRVKQIAADSKILIALITESVSVGEPENDTQH